MAGKDSHMQRASIDSSEQEKEEDGGVGGSGRTLFTGRDVNICMS